MIIESATILAHETVSGEFRLLTMKAPGISAAARSGQFVHLRVPNLESSALRRPFSIFKADSGKLAILYKPVGAGTLAMINLRKGDRLSLLGPLGNGFPAPDEKSFPVLVAGGYGVAALRLLAERLAVKGIVFVGAGCASDLLCLNEFRQLGWDARATTEDGSEGTPGMVTEALRGWLAMERLDRNPEFFACGPREMLKALTELAVKGEWKAWISMEQHMGCGVGACLGCAQKVKAPPSQGYEGKDNAGKEWEWARVCADGPVFECREIVW